MAVKIGHASIDENGKAKNGVAGDQTGKEVCIRDWYNRTDGWHTLIRPKEKQAAEKIAKAIEQACANDNIGYDQNQRTTLYDKAKSAGWDLSKITEKCECDCSSLVHTCAIAGGANLKYGDNGLTTRTMVKAFKESGDYDALTDKKYLTSDKELKRGDIVVKEGSHTFMILEDGTVKLYRVQCGAFSKLENAKKLQEKLIKDGYDTIIV